MNVRSNTLLTTDKIIIRTVYNQSLNDCNQGQNNWVKKVKRVLSEHGLYHVFDNQGNTNAYIFINVVKQRVVDCFEQGWSGPVNESTVLTIYKEFKVSFEYEHYLDLHPSHLRCLVSRVWLSYFHCACKPVAMQEIEYLETCLFCDTSDIYDEYHFSCVCPNLNHIRKRYIKLYYYHSPSVFKYLELVKSYDKSALFGLANFERHYVIETIYRCQMPTLTNR